MRLTSLLRATASSSSTLKGREPVHRYYTRGKIYDTFFKATIGGIMVFSVGVCSFVLFDVVRMITRERPASKEEAKAAKAKAMAEKQQAAIEYLRMLETEKNKATPTESSS